ncbi:MAG: hypothetical protein MI743_07275, partial [Sneathiellales bacterium]|nr:hypothetical protein [Sneathiellales bacterium]
MRRIDISRLLTAGTPEVPAHFWSKFNNSWLLLNRTHNTSTYIVAYQACYFYAERENDGQAILVPRGFPGEVGTVWGYKIPIIWRRNQRSQDNEFFDDEDE